MLGIAAGDEIRRRGYDGQIHFVGTHPFIPQGVSVWEMGTGDPKDKFNTDYKNRSEQPGSAKPEETTFVFVTPHSWEGKTRAEADAKADGNGRTCASSTVPISKRGWRWCQPLRDGSRLRWASRSRDWMTQKHILEWYQPDGLTFLPELIIGGRTDALDALISWLKGVETQLTIECESPEEAAVFVADVGETTGRESTVPKHRQ